MPDSIHMLSLRFLVLTRLYQARVESIWRSSSMSHASHVLHPTLAAQRLACSLAWCYPKGPLSRESSIFPKRNEIFVVLCPIFAQLSKFGEVSNTSCLLPFCFKLRKWFRALERSDIHAVVGTMIFLESCVLLLIAESLPDNYSLCFHFGLLRRVSACFESCETDLSYSRCSRMGRRSFGLSDKLVRGHHLGAAVLAAHWGWSVGPRSGSASSRGARWI